MGALWRLRLTRYDSELQEKLVPVPREVSLVHLTPVKAEDPDTTRQTHLFSGGGCVSERPIIGTGERPSKDDLVAVCEQIVDGVVEIRKRCCVCLK